MVMKSNAFGSFCVGLVEEYRFVGNVYCALYLIGNRIPFVASFESVMHLSILSRLVGVGGGGAT